MKNKYLVGAAILLLIVVGLSSYLLIRPTNKTGTTQNSPTSETTDSTTPQNQDEAVGTYNTPSGKPVATNVISAVNDSGISGNFEIKDADYQTLVEVSVTGAPEGLPQPVHIQTGTCGALGEERYPLLFLNNGKSESIIEASLEQIRTEAPLSITIRKSVEEAATVVACGEIKV